jgi:predicted NodU family carbamoyl transferase
METDVYNKLNEIRKRLGSQKFGQICQDLLALSIAEAGLNTVSVEVNNIEGMDIIIDDNNFGRYAIEVKITSGETIKLGEKDYNGFKKYGENKYNTILAVLKIDLHEEWILADVSKRRRKYNLKVNELYTKDEYKELANEINKNFGKLVKENYEGILKEGMEYLKRKLKEKNIKYSGG